MRRKYFDLILIVIIVTINVLWVYFAISLPAVGIFLALPLVFFLPGYAFTEIFATKLALRDIYRVIFSIGLSVTIDIIGGLILNFFPTGLRATSWTILLGLLTTAFTLVAAYLRRKQTPRNPQWPASRLRLRFPEYMLLALSLLLIILSFQYSANQVAQPRTSFTQLWILPSTKNDPVCSVHVGMQSFETTTVTFRVTVDLNHVQVYTWQPVVLAPKQAWNQLISFSPKSTGAIYVDVRLYKADQPTVMYREVYTTRNPIEIKSTGIFRC